ncbi:MAG: zinc-dependent alcohol dehydrogenase, partial [Actinomycetota bacterium]|nr:zinc-dependent alcohol dehydrogenase [Actinomycetota bacterium]
RVVREGIDVIGSPGPARVDIADVFTLHQARRTRVVHQARSLRQVNEAMAELAEDKVPARLVFELR